MRELLRDEPATLFDVSRPGKMVQSDERQHLGSTYRRDDFLVVRQRCLIEFAKAWFNPRPGDRKAEQLAT
jgi:hypothetical protein